jgi:hypothetical protein
MVLEDVGQLPHPDGLRVLAKGPRLSGCRDVAAHLLVG